MCGLVGLIDPFIGKLEIDILEQMLYADALRGFHSTGVSAFYKDNIKNQNTVLTVKDALPAAHFMSLREYDDWVTEVLRKNTRILMGHNRLATRGKINRNSSHPFIVANIVLAHNGSLIQYNNLPNHQYFSVDSHAIAYSMADLGVEETVARLDGAFALTWIDRGKGTFNIIRNTQRPLSLRTNAGNTRAAWASEEMMLDWILNRKGQLYSLKDKWEVDPGHWLEFDLNSREPADFQTWKLDMYKPKTYNTQHSNANNNNRGGGDNHGYQGNQRKGGKQQQQRQQQSPIIMPDASQNKQLPAANGDGGGVPSSGETKRDLQKAAKLEEFGLIRGEKFRFHAYVFTPYTPTDPHSLGFVDGNMERDPYLAVEIHQVSIEDFIEQATYVAQASAISNYNTYDTLIGDNMELIELPDSHPAKERIKRDHPDRMDTDAESAPPFDEEEDTGERFIGPTGRSMTKKDMVYLCRHGCCNCDDPIEEDEYDSIGWTQSGAPLCKTCQGQYDGIFVMNQGGRLH